MPRIPGYKRHKSGLAYVRYKPLFGKNPKYLGKHGTKQSLAEYEKVLAQILAHMRGEGVLPEPVKPIVGRASIAELVNGFLDAVESRYSRKEFDHYQIVCRLLMEDHRMAVANFGPLALKSVREKMVARGWSRTHVNHQTKRIRNVFRWGVEHELVETATVHNLDMVAMLRKGEMGVKETSKVKPVDWDVAALVVPHVPPIVADMIRVQHFTGMRSDELTGLRPCEITMTADVWEYRPERHKTAHLEIDKVVCIGPQAQAILQQYMPDDTQGYFFTPAKAVAQRKESRAASRTSKAYGKPKRRTRQLRERYDAHSYQAAINHGFRRMAGLVLGIERNKHGSGRRKREPLKTLLTRAGVAFWHPHQLRHTRATVTQDTHGYEASAAIIGDSLATAKIYAERALKKARLVARETG